MKPFLVLLLFTGLFADALAQAGGEDCATATIISSIPYVGTGSTSGAADDYAEICPDYGNQGGARDVVYKYTTGAGVEYITLSLCIDSTDYDSQLYVYEGTCQSGTSYACQEDGCQSPAYTGGTYNSEIINLMLQPNTDYYVVIDGYSSGSSGNYQLNVDSGAAPPATQITFGDSTALLPGSTIAARSGSPMAISDMNNDGLDDILRLHTLDTMLIAYQQPNGSFTGVSLGNIAPFNAVWGICVADVDSNGYNDFAVGDYSSIRVFVADSVGGTYTSATINTSSIFVQGMNFVDIDNDGDVELFSCNDVGESHLYEQTSTGWIRNTTILDLTTTPSSDKSGNYASMFTDIDGDGDLDLYITKCRQGVTDPADGRRINQWIENTGSGMWSENTNTILRDSAQSWVSDFADIDNDGDFDVFTANHDQVSRFYRNLGNGVFEEYTTQAGLTQTAFAGIQTYFRDFNNDGYVDLLMTGSEHRLWINNGDTTFTLDIDPFAAINDWMLSAVIGDLNHDGFLDLYCSYGFVYNGAHSSAIDRLWINQGASGYHFIAVNLHGVASNDNAIGARVEIYGPWGIQVREVRAGEGYGTQNSFTQHFGLGTTTLIDSMLIKWPSGTIDYLYNVSADQWLHITEGDFPFPPVILSGAATNNVTSNTAELSVQMNLREDYDTDVLFYYWPEGGTTQIAVSGTYNLGGGGTQVFSPMASLNNLISDTSYYWTVQAIFDPASQNQLFTYDTLGFQTAFDSVEVEISGFQASPDFWIVDAQFDVLLREDSATLVELHHFHNSLGIYEVDSVTTLSLNGGGTQTFPLTQTAWVYFGQEYYKFFVRAVFNPDGSGKEFFSDTLSVLTMVEGLEELPFEVLIFYPQPTKGTITVEINASWDPNTLRYILTDAQGRQISESIFRSDREQINIRGAAGVYFLHVRSEDGRSRSYRIIRQ